MENNNVISMEEWKRKKEQSLVDDEFRKQADSLNPIELMQALDYNAQLLMMTGFDKVSQAKYIYLIDKMIVLLEGDPVKDRYVELRNAVKGMKV